MYYKVLGALGLVFLSCQTLVAQAAQPRIGITQVGLVEMGPSNVSTQPILEKPTAFEGGNDDQSTGHFTGFFGTYFLQPHFEKNNALTVTKTIGQQGFEPAGSVTSTIEQDFSYNLIASPVVQIGYVTPSGLGFRSRWFQFEESSTGQLQVPVPDFIRGVFSVSSPTIQGLSETAGGIVPSNVFTGSGLNLDVLDFDVTQDIHCGNWTLLVGGGVRYLHMSQRYSFARITASSSDSSLLLSGQNFNGVGPSLVFEGTRAFKRSGLALYVNGRASILFGSGKQHTATSDIIPIPAFNTQIDNINETDARRQDVLPVIEAEVGVQYSVECGRLNPFLRTGLVGQSYFGAGSASSVEGNLGLFGFSLTAGVNY